MPMLDIFNNEAFSTLELTNAINVVPNQFGRIGEIGLFAPKSTRTTSVAVEFNNGVLNLIPAGTRGGPANLNKTGKRQLKNFNIPHFPLEDQIKAEDVQNIRAFGSENELEQVQDVVNDRLIEMSRKHDITREWLRAGALRGTIMDSDGSVLLNLFTEFGVTEKVVDFVLGTAGTDVAGKCREVSRHIELNLKGDTFNGVHALCSPTWFDKFVNHATVKDAYAFYLGMNPLREDVRRRFVFQGIVFEEYLGSATDADGNERKFIVEGDVRFFPLGTTSSFFDYSAPADFMETVNTLGLPKYAKQAIDAKFARYVDIHTQMNPLPICLRPALLVRGHSSN
jgi:hypothetical protein